MDGYNIPLVIGEAFTPAPFGLEYISTAKRLEEELVQHPTNDPNGNPISPSILAQLVLFNHYHVRATHPQYNYFEFQYYIEKYSWEWCYSDMASPNYLPFPGICPHIRSEKVRAVLPYEARLMPKFGVPRDPHPPTAPRHEEGNPWVHFRRLVPLMEEMWHVLDGIVRGNQGQTPQDLRQLRSQLPRPEDRSDAWLSLKDAVSLLYIYVGFRETQSGPVDILPDFYSLLLQQGQEGNIYVHQ